VKVVIIATASLYAQFDLNGVQNATGWYISQGYVGNDTSTVFSITSGTSGQYLRMSTSVSVVSPLIMLEICSGFNISNVSFV
jgi:hypothetical protein